jgi:hypothetical protein
MNNFNRSHAGVEPARGVGELVVAVEKADPLTVG